MSRKKKQTRRFTKEQKHDAVKYFRESDLKCAEAARNLGIAPSTLRGWVEQADIDEGHGPEGALTTEEKAEIRRLRRENKDLRMQRDFLKKATAFFAKETDITK